MFVITAREITAPPSEDTLGVFNASFERFRLSCVESLADTGLVAAVNGFYGTEALWAGEVNTRIIPALGAEYIAFAAKKARKPDKRTAGRLVWPEGVDGPETVDELMSMFPATFAGVDPLLVSAVIVSPQFLVNFRDIMQQTKNLVVGMPDSWYRTLTTRLATVADSGMFEKQRIVREFLSWEDEGGYEGWMRRAERIARTEVHHARQSAGHLAAMMESEAGEDVVKVWHTARDERVRPGHREAQGQQKQVDQPFEVDGDLLDYPGDREHGRADNTINCRCAVSYMSPEAARELDELPDLFEMTDTEIEDYMDSLNASAGEPNMEWSGVLAPIGEATGDGRLFDAGGEFRFRSFPLPLLWQESTSDAHDQSRIVGVITSGSVEDNSVRGEGYIYSREERVLELLADGVLRPSVDLCDVVADYDEDAETMVITSATVMAATLVATPAFEGVDVTLTGREVEPALVASASAVMEKLPTYSASFFDDPQLGAPTPVTIDRESGRVFGHLALWDSCHVGLPGRCVQPPHSSNAYASFHQSTVVTDEAERIAVGRLTVGGGHASPTAGVRAAAEHYDTTGACWAFVRAGEDEHGIWVAGEINHAATAEQLSAAESAPLSGDWRRVGAGLELVAALSVSTPGFPVRREFSADNETMDTLVASSSLVHRCDNGEADNRFEAGARYARAVDRFTRLELKSRLSAVDKRVGGED